jgi:hypothetical protein
MYVAGVKQVPQNKKVLLDIREIYIRQTLNADFLQCSEGFVTTCATWCC